MEYNFREIEEKWRQRWKQDKVYQVNNPGTDGGPVRPKCYVLDMFPYPSGAGLHVGHPLGYIASDIYSRYKRLKGFNVLHPMGFDSFGLPAEQYAIETGQHPATTTEKNITTFKAQLDKIGFCYDWEREVLTSDPSYYKWTQWLFLQLFNSYFCNTQKKARPIADLIKKYETEGSANFSATDWNGYAKSQQADILMKRRLAFSAYGEVNWCEGLGTVLANDEVVNGVSERGGFPVVKKKMRQWYLRITAYADRLLEGLETVNFSEAMKDMQRNWIGKSEGAELEFPLSVDPATGGDIRSIKVYTTRPDTIFGVDFIVLAPEHQLVESITTEEQRRSIDEYLAYVKSRSDRERMAEVKQVTGCFTGAYATNPFDGKKIPIWIAEYVLAGYGTGAIMAVPCGDQRDFTFAKHFDITITNIIGDHYKADEANPTKDAVLQNSGFLDNLLMKDAIEVAINKIEEQGVGRRKVNYRMRDAGFSRQRYWGEPFPIIWQDGIAVPLNENELPLELPHVEKYGPGPEGEGPLANIWDWVNVNRDEFLRSTSENVKGFTNDELKNNLSAVGQKINYELSQSETLEEGDIKLKRETSTMPGYAGSSWYFLRYMDPKNDSSFCDRKISDYWNQVDVYIGGTEHAVGHLLYSRMWTKVMFDLNLIGFDEPFKKLVNQGMIQGSSRFVYRIKGTNEFVSSGLKNNYEVDALHVDVNLVDGVELDMQAFLKWKPDYADATFIVEQGKYICGIETEKMSKRYFNTVDPVVLTEKYGADTFRMYEMFLGPVEQSKPWDTKGIEGVHRFLRKLWRLFFDEIKGRIWTAEKATDAELKVLHKAIKKIESDTENFSFNTAVSAFMISVNELADIKCHKKEILEQVLILLVPYAPHIAEELWQQLENKGTILDAAYPTLNEKYLVESFKEYPVSVNGKLRTAITVEANALQPAVEKLVLENEIIQKWLEGKSPKKIIFVKGKMVNVVL